MTTSSKLIEYLIINYRWLLVTLFLLPLSLLYDGYYHLRNYLIFKLKSAPNEHDKKVKVVQRQVREWKENGSKTQMCTARPGWQAMSLRVGKYKQTMNNVYIDMLDILEINTTKRYIRVEPLVNMGQITTTLTPLGWTLPVVPELDDLTIGGMINGTGVETSSHIYGLFQNICLAFEVVLADGSLVRCTKDENSDLFYGIPWSHGSLGFLVAAEIAIIPCKPFVKIQYLPQTTQEDLVKVFTEEATKADPYQFVEGLVYSKDSGVIMIGEMVDSAEPDKLNILSEYHKPWFFKHVETILNGGNPVTEYIPIRDYYHRHTRSLFWEIQDIIPFGNNYLFRHLFGWASPPKVSFLKLTQGETIRKLYEKHHFVQDFLLPIETLKNSITFFDEAVQIYPIWLCPHTMHSQGFVHSHNEEQKMYVDIGLYGNPKSRDYEAVKTTRKCEAYARSLRGHQMLYADSYQTKEEFRQMFDHSLYDNLRNKLDCSKAFPEVYDKVSKAARH